MKRGSLRRFMAVVGVVLFGLIAIREGSYLVRLAWWRSHPPASTSFMRDRLGELRKKDPKASIDRRWVSYERISGNLKRAIVAAEDTTFTTHSGFDWQGIQKAYEKNLKRGRIVSGGSTISQQLARNLFLSARRTPWRKAEEALVTVMAEAVLPKRRILEIYLNSIEWGERTYGAEAAARRTFGVAAADLTARQAAYLAAVVPSPRLHERRGETAYIASRIATILARMPQVDIP
jgi:monofunctional biosynthetic peptidoglycan transglycosylase